MANTTLNIGTVYVGTIDGSTNGSVITATSLPTGFTINSASRSWRYDGTGTPLDVDITLVETLAGAVNTPRTTIMTLNIKSVSSNTVNPEPNTAPISSLSAPTIIQTSNTGANPLEMRITLPDAIDHVSNGLELQITQTEVSNNVPDWTSALSEERQINEYMVEDGLLFGIDSDLNTFPVFNALRPPMSGGKNYARFREKTYNTFNKGIAVEGDQITADVYGWHYDWSSKNPLIPFFNVSGSGRILNSLSGDYNGVTQYTQRTTSYKPAVVAIYIGTNDLSGTDPDQWINDLWAHAASIRASLPGTRIVVGTLLPNGKAGYSQHNVKRVSINNQIRAAVGTKIDAVMDFAGDSRIGVDSATSNTSYWSSSDLMNPGAGAIIIMQQIATPVLAQQYQIATTPLVVSPWSNVVYDNIAGGAIAAITKFDTTKRNNFATLTADQRTVFGTNNAPYQKVLSTTSIVSGKVYFEVPVTKVNTRSPAPQFGLCLDAPPVVPTDFSSPGYGDRLGFVVNDRIVYSDTSSNPAASLSAAAVPYALGDACAMAIDATPGSRKVWFRNPSNGAWLNGDPATGSGGYTLISELQTAPLFIFVAVNGDYYMTLNTGQDTFKFSLPTGFKAVG